MLSIGFLCLIFVVVYLILGIYSLVLNPKKAISRVFFMISVIFAFWSLSAALRNIYSSAEIISLWHFSSAIAWSIGSPAILHFVLLLIRKKSQKYRAFLIYLPGIFLFLAQYSQGYLFGNYDQFQSDPIFGAMGINVLYMVYLVVSCLFLLYWGWKSQKQREKIQSRVVSVTLLLTAFLIFFYGTVLSSLVDFILPFITPLFPMIWFTGMWVAITRYRLMTLSADSVVEKIMDNVLDLVIVIDADGKIVDINRRCLDILGKAKKTVCGTEFSETILNDQEGIQHFDDLRRGRIDEIEGEMIYRLDETRSMPLRVRINAVKDDFNDIQGYIVAARDLSIEKKFEWLSITDKLTQIYNRQKLDSVIESEMNRALRYKGSFSIIMVDIDDFKRINDTCGHIAGDRILVELTRLIQRNIRKVDILGRWGGEEFLIILPDCNIKSGRSVAEKIRKTIETHQFDIEESLTCSFGVSEFEADRKIEKIVARADAALYVAKSHGKNRVESLEKS